MALKADPVIPNHPPLRVSDPLYESFLLSFRREILGNYSNGLENDEKRRLSPVSCLKRPLKSVSGRPLGRAECLQNLRFQTLGELLRAQFRKFPPRS